MALFDRANLVQIPSGYKEGKLYNIKPFDQPFEFSRGSAATRVNEDGLIEYVGIGEELASNNTISNSGGAIASIDGLSVSASSDGTGGSTLRPKIDFNDLVDGETYLITFSNIVTTGTIGFSLYNGSSYEINQSSEIPSSFVFTKNGIKPFIALNGNNTFTANFDISLKQISNDTPRIDYTNGKALLLEPQRTNLVTYSEDFSEWNVGTGGISIDTGYLAPDGSNNATKVTMDSNFSTTALALNLGLGTTETRTIYARTVSGTGQANLCSYNGNTNNLFTITEEWQRFEVNGAISTGAISLYAVDFRGSTDLNEIIIWGAQAEQGSYATSYIPTNGQTETRLADVCDNAGDSTIFNDDEGVLFAEIAALDDDGTNRQITISDGSSTNRVYLGLRTQSNQVIGSSVSGGVENFINHTLSDTTTNFKLAFKYKQNDLSLFLNGTQVGFDNTANTPIGLNELSFDNGDGTQNFHGKVKALAYFPEALTDTELQELTTI